MLLWLNADKATYEILVPRESYCLRFAVEVDIVAMVMVRIYPALLAARNSATAQCVFVHLTAGCSGQSCRW